MEATDKYQNHCISNHKITTFASLRVEDEVGKDAGEVFCIQLKSTWRCHFSDLRHQSKRRMQTEVLHKQKSSNLSTYLGIPFVGCFLLLGLRITMMGFHHLFGWKCCTLFLVVTIVLVLRGDCVDHAALDDCVCASYVPGVCRVLGCSQSRNGPFGVGIVGLLRLLADLLKLIKKFNCIFRRSSCIALLGFFIGNFACDLLVYLFTVDILVLVMMDFLGILRCVRYDYFVKIYMKSVYVL
ncbi:hypothetical protein EGR_06259 [Echinococcus granulosus]|uniref:Uncharacterized protein n=1 Tax=Echinococcus granulosus TaxID=6210 RepID=W6UC90_ECHGR|nr:hypothetical protein EGR_06259 [Echinococcus granulosus]EUB58835.1 hypothetical protein EGR_06259 [Echinococcus granulosus]